MSNSVDPIDEFISASTNYVLALIDARMDRQRINGAVISTKQTLREQLIALLGSRLGG